jgi:hypothetical protein
MNVLRVVISFINPDRFFSEGMPKAKTCQDWCWSLFVY